VLAGATMMGNPPRVMVADVAAGAVTGGDTLAAEPLKVNGLVAAELLI
jgi:hypothetical protein